MKFRCWRGCLIAVAALLVASVPAWSAALSIPQSAPGNAPLSERVVAYQIEGRYDAKTHTLDATELLTYTNKTGTQLDRFPFHLYLNAFQPKSTFMTEAERNGQRDAEKGAPWNSKHFGSNTVKSLEIVGAGGTSREDVTQQMKFIAPDDGNANDRTVFEIALPKPLAPGAQIQFRIHFVAKFPEVVARTGYKGDFLMAGQWFPKVGVWWNGAWNCHQFHANTEFFADFGTFDVKLTLPAKWNVGSSGVQTGARDNGDGTQTVSLHAEDIHDFAWTASPVTKVVEDSIELRGHTVKIRILMQPGHMATAPRYMQALKGTMHRFDEWIGAYPYPQITVVDPPHGGEAAGGMEYPTLITADTTWWMPKWLLEPEAVVEHEFGHQYWYGMVATNEFEDAWMDEGINQYMEAKVMDSMYGQDTSSVRSRLATLGERGVDLMSYAPMADRDPLSRPAWGFENSGSYGAISYSKTALMMLTLESLIGEKTVMHGLREYFERYRFKHPTPEQFTAAMNEAVGQDLDWYWKQAIYGTETLDDRILSAGSERVDWYSAQPEKKGITVYHNEVVVHRRGTFDLPVELAAKFDDGSTVREHWDGKDRWHRFSWDRKSKLVSAEVDPNHGYWLDRDPFNNSWMAKANGRATGKLAGYWTLLTQWLEQMASWLA
ncbi:MAG: M1 family metallopeptidase [Candidatus Korobacteraceae bacterium]